MWCESGLRADVEVQNLQQLQFVRHVLHRAGGATAAFRACVHI
jgi:hypothetical protein